MKTGVVDLALSIREIHTSFISSVYRSFSSVLFKKVDSMTSRFSLTILLTGLLTVCACAQSRKSGTDSGTYARTIQPILDAKCTSCHGAGQEASGLRLDTWAATMAGSEFGEAVIPFDADNSVLVEMVEKLASGPHPSESGAATLSAAEVDQIKGWINEGAIGPDGQIAGADATDLVYVANQADARVYIIDAASQTVVRTVDLQALGYSANAKPHHVAVEKDGSFWYVSMIAENRVLKFNRNNELVGYADFQVPGLLTIDRTSDLMFVGRSMAAVNPPQSVGMITRSTMEIDEIGVFHPRPHAIMMDPAGSYLYSGSLGENRILTLEIETGDGTVHNVDGTTHTLVQFGITPDGNTLIVGGQLTGKLFFFDASNPPALPLVKTIDVNAAPWHPSMSADNKWAYLGNKMAGTVTVVDMEQMSVAAVIKGDGLSQPHGSALTRDGRFLYVTGNNLNGGYSARHAFGDNEKPGTVTIIDTSTNTIVKVLELGAHAAGIGTRPVE